MRLIIIFVQLLLATQFLYANSTSTDSLDLHIPDSSIVVQQYKIAIIVNGKDSHERLTLSTGIDSSNDTLTSFFLTEPKNVLTINYSGYRNPQKLIIDFIENGVLIDSSSAKQISIINKLYKKTQNALLISISLKQTGWITTLRSDSSYLGIPIPIKINNKQTRKSLHKKGASLSLNRYDLNSIIVAPPKQYRKGYLYIEYKDPYGPPSVTSIKGLQATITLNKTKKKAIITAKLLPEQTEVTIITKVKYANAQIRNCETNQTQTITETSGTDKITLKCHKTYELVIEKPGYNQLRKVFKIRGVDTTLTYTWIPMEKKQIVLRSLFIPGWGQYHHTKDNKNWRWTAGSYGSAFVMLCSSISFIGASKDFDEYNSKYLNDSRKIVRDYYDGLRKEARSDMRKSTAFFFSSLGTTGIIWIANLYNAVTRSPGPDSRVKLNATTRGGNLTIDF